MIPAVMNRWKRLAFYLLLNVLVSACTMMVVLYFWGRINTRPLATAEPVALALPTLTPDLRLTQPLTPTPKPTLALEAYQVQPGDTLSSIALLFDISLETLMELNGLTDPNALGSGEVLLIPVTQVPPPATPTEIPATVPATGSLPPTEAVPPNPASGQQVQILTIVGPGVLQDERVVIQHAGEGELPMVDWQLEDSNGNRFVFPQLTLFKGGEVWVYTRAGANTVAELFWGRTETVWQVGETARLLDPQGEVKAEYRVP